MTKLNKSEKLEIKNFAIELLQERGAYYKPHKKQLEFHNLVAKERLFIAGNRVGKTVAGANEMAMHLTGIYPDWWTGKRFDAPIRGWCASVNNVFTRDVLQVAYIGSEDTGSFGTIPKSLITKKVLKSGVSGAYDTVYVKHTSGGQSKLSFKSYDQGWRVFQGDSQHFIHLDEEPTLKLYEECLMRTLDVGGCVITTMTPLLGMTDVCLMFLDGRTEGVASKGRGYTQASWDDNPHLAKEDKEHLSQALRPHEREARINGVPTLGAGKVFPVTEEGITCEPFIIPDHWTQCFGMDFGWTNPTAVVFIAHDKDNDIIYIHKTYSQSELTPQSHTNNLFALGCDWIKGVCDPAGQMGSQSDGINLITKYEEAGLKLDRANNSVEFGIQEMLERMQTGRFKVFNNLDSWMREFRIYRRKEGSGLIVKENDHLMDATRYGVVSGLELATTKTTKEEPPRMYQTQSSSQSWMG